MTGTDLFGAPLPSEGKGRPQTKAAAPAAPSSAPPLAMPAITIDRLPHFISRAPSTFNFDGISPVMAFGPAVPPDATQREAVLLWAARALTPVGTLNLPAAGSVAVRAYTWDLLQAAIARTLGAASPAPAPAYVPHDLGDLMHAARAYRWLGDVTRDMRARITRHTPPECCAAAYARAFAAVDALAEALEHAAGAAEGACHEHFNIDTDAEASA